MNDLNILLHDADPAGGLAGLDLHDARAELLDELVTSPVPLSSRRSLRTRLAVGVVAAAAVTAAVAVPALTSRDRDVTVTGFTPAAVRVAESNPRLVVDLPGWAVTHVYGFEKVEGTVAYSDGQRELEVNWLPARNHAGLVRERTIDASKPVPITLAGQDAQLFRYGARDYAVITEPDDGVFAELRTGLHGWKDRAAVLDALSHVRGVDVRTWLEAMPPLVTKPGAIPAAVEEILSGVPVPPGFDAEARDLHGVYDEYQLTVQVLDPLLCGWVSTWKQAIDDGDTAGARAAVEALGGSRTWPSLRKISVGTGEFAQGVWPTTDAIKDGTTTPLRAAESFGCP